MSYHKCDKFDDLLECLFHRLAHFETDCALLQRSVNGRIITGPITYHAYLDFLTIKAFPKREDILFTNASGTPLSSVNPGDTFYISVPETDETYIVDLVVYLDICRYGDSLASNSDLMSILYGFSCPKPRPELPDCYFVFDSLRFYINPAPCGCGCGCDDRRGCRCGCGRGCGCGRLGGDYVIINGIKFGRDCIRPRGVVAPETDDGSFEVPCCRDWDWHKC